MFKNLVISGIQAYPTCRMISWEFKFRSIANNKLYYHIFKSLSMIACMIDIQNSLMSNYFTNLSWILSIKHYTLYFHPVR